MDITSLQNALGTNVTNSVNSGVQDQLEKLITWIMIPSIVLTIVILVVYIAHIIHRHKIDTAIIEIRDTLREMKLAQTTPAQAKLEIPESVMAVTPTMQSDTLPVPVETDLPQTKEDTTAAS